MLTQRQSITQKQMPISLIFNLKKGTSIEMYWHKFFIKDELSEEIGTIYANTEHNFREILNEKEIPGNSEETVEKGEPAYINKTTLKIVRTISIEEDKILQIRENGSFKFIAPATPFTVTGLDENENKKFNNKFTFRAYDKANDKNEQSNHYNNKATTDIANSSSYILNTASSSPNNSSAFFKENNSIRPSENSQLLSIDQQTSEKSTCCIII